jgi:hypothetical protein
MILFFKEEVFTILRGEANSGVNVVFVKVRFLLNRGLWLLLKDVFVIWTVTLFEVNFVVLLVSQLI